jgi:hypothetical protein
VALDNRDDNLERDPRIARLLAAAGGEEPPAALDAAILAAARRGADARPQLVGGDGHASIPPLRAKRNWYMPVSIAAVLVLSVSLVTLVHEEKGDELAQPPGTAGAPSKSSAPAPAAPATSAPGAVVAEKPDAMLRDAAPATPKHAEEKRAEPAKVTEATAAPEAYAGLAKKQRAGKIESTADGAATLGAVRKDQPASVAAREQGPPASDSATALKSAPSVAKASPEPFPAQARASRDAVEARTRSEAERSTPHGVIQDAPAVMTPVAPSPATVAPLAKVIAAPRRTAAADDALAQSAPPVIEGRVLATSPPPPVKPAPAPAAKPALRLLQKPAPLWRGLEEQPPEKWLERLAEFKRDGRQADADELLTEFRRRFPDHPASAR